MVQFIIIHSDSSQISVLQFLVLSTSQLIPCLSCPKVPRYSYQLQFKCPYLCGRMHTHTHTHLCVHTHTHTLCLSLIHFLSLHFLPFCPRCQIQQRHGAHLAQPAFPSYFSQIHSTVRHHNRSAELAKGVVGIIYVDKF